MPRTLPQNELFSTRFSSGGAALDITRPLEGLRVTRVLRDLCQRRSPEATGALGIEASITHFLLAHLAHTVQTEQTCL
ncbi:hypothetical protein L596_011608 [Steinernema carpocapsae]|uniref:Uncharacterized protein n=1 Tax=Steinernema carpocapsae TaxID=34508 RepID=A0A4U5NV81_STECR|nr:hypothetical protein L596_011608 [Steinernema carpocapsae]